MFAASLNRLIYLSICYRKATDHAVMPPLRDRLCREMQLQQAYQKDDHPESVFFPAEALQLRNWNGFEILATDVLQKITDPLQLISFLDRKSNDPVLLEIQFLRLVHSCRKKKPTTFKSPHQEKRLIVHGEQTSRQSNRL